MYAATIELVAGSGYGALTATAIAAAAGVSKRTFYENFSDKDHCLFATYDVIVQEVVRGVLAAQRGALAPDDRLRAGFAAFAREVASKPEAARLALLEILAVGPRASEKLRHTNGLFEALIAKSFADLDDGVELSPLVPKAIVAGCSRVARARLLAGREQDLPGEADDLLDWALSVRAGATSCPASIEPHVPTYLLTRSPFPGGRLQAFVSRDGGGGDRALVLSAAVNLAAGHGYNALTPGRICKGAGISRRRLDRHFESTDECFFAGIELLTAHGFAISREAFKAADTWSEGVRRAIDALCAELADDPVLLRLLFFEVFAAGMEFTRWRFGYTSTLASTLRRISPPDERPSELEAEASVAAVWALLQYLASIGRGGEMGRFAGALAAVVLAPSSRRARSSPVESGPKPRPRQAVVRRAA
jgi:AcrR family transcriptional regulator